MKCLFKTPIDWQPNYFFIPFSHLVFGIFLLKIIVQDHYVKRKVCVHSPYDLSNRMVESYGEHKAIQNITFNFF